MRALDLRVTHIRTDDLSYNRVGIYQGERVHWCPIAQAWYLIGRQGAPIYAPAERWEDRDAREAAELAAQEDPVITWLRTAAPGEVRVRFVGGKGE